MKSKNITVKAKSEWKLISANELFVNVSEKNHPNEELLSVTQDMGVIPRKLLPARVTMPTKGLEAFKLVEQGNFLISLRSFQGGIEYSEYRGIVSPAYTVIKKKIDLNDSFYIQYFKSAKFIHDLDSSVIGIRDGKQISFNSFKKIKMPLPPLPEQKKISDILSSVDEAIRATQAVIDQTKTLKQGLLYQLLTKGIGHKKYKQTEIGEIPVEWEVVSIEQIGAKEKYAIVDGPFGSNLKSEHYRNNGVPVIQSGFVTSGIYYAEKYLYVDMELFKEQQRSRVVADDIVMAKIGANAGTSAIIPSHFDYGILAGNCLKITINKNMVVNEYVLSWLHYRFLLNGFREIKTITAQPAISLANLRKFPIPLPPLPEQKMIAEILSSIDETIRENTNNLDQLKVIKSGLMQDLLTGKKRVQYAQP